MEFKFTKDVEGDTGYLIFATNSEDIYKEFNRDVIESIVEPDVYFSMYYCNELVVDVVNTRDMMRCRSGSVYDFFLFHGEGHKDDDIMFTLTRFRPNIVHRSILNAM